MVTKSDGLMRYLMLEQRCFKAAVPETIERAALNAGIRRSQLNASQYALARLPPDPITIQAARLHPALSARPRR